MLVKDEDEAEAEDVAMVNALNSTFDFGNTVVLEVALVLALFVVDESPSVCSCFWAFSFGFFILLVFAPSPDVLVTFFAGGPGSSRTPTEDDAGRFFPPRAFGTLFCTSEPWCDLLVVDSSCCGGGGALVVDDRVTRCVVVRGPIVSMEVFIAHLVPEGTVAELHCSR